MNDLLWSMGQRSRILQELRKDIHGVWQDEAARELTSRYLNPHQSEDQRMLTNLQAQETGLEQAQEKLNLAKESSIQANDYAGLVDENLQESERELQSVYSTYDSYVHYNSEAKSKFPQIENLINLANSSCNS